ncbi:MAG: hypothetical protein JRF59_15490 [Deltaproteobacteria bacterium]|nr:hypothetical protein [Deltaproteobacteria bacterium]MBW1949314.1 hypothetical protein [Deltaproteobacteria bacterium]MBW2009108.1 hypothetical protein [Deltaproteobacteria bacterium]MBW2349216.1 hypothetical protein [Deltaproteobacteria bacterium]
MSPGGFAGNTIYVDLSTGVIEKRPLDLGLAEKFQGGLGLCIRLAHEAISPGRGALSPENPIVLGTGPLVGTHLPATSRLYAVTKLPTSGTVGWCGSGGVNFACMLKNAGFDHVVIRGRAERPVYLEIFNDDMKIRDAGHLWGKGVEETDAILWEKYGRPTGILAIGQAGENLVPFSMAFVEGLATLGRGGFGAVMGSKNLKAVVARGERGIRVADKKRYKEVSRAFLKSMREYPYLKEWQDLGLVKSFPLVPVEQYKAMKKRRVACVSCPVGCKDVVEIPDGEYRGLVKGTSSVINLYTPVIYGFKDYRESIRFMALLDDYGLDMFEFFGIMGFTAELTRRGIIPAQDVDPEIRVDSLASMSAWAEKISLRRGLGDLLAGGFPGILEALGPEAEPFAPSLVKGMHPYAGPGSSLPWDLFGTMELGQVLDPRGPHVGAGGSPTYFAKRPLEVFPKHLRRMGVPEGALGRILQKGEAEDEEGILRVGRLLRYSHRWFAILGSLGVCARAAINRFYSVSACAEMAEAVTGFPTDPETLELRADRSWTLLRIMNLRDGFSRNKQETLPDRWFREDGFKDYATGDPLRPETVEKMIEDYYGEWGWDLETGAPTPETIARLSLEEESKK